MKGVNLNFCFLGSVFYALFMISAVFVLVTDQCNQPLIHTIS